MNKVQAFKIRAKHDLEGILKTRRSIQLSVRQVEVLAKLRNDPELLLEIWKQAKDSGNIGPKVLRELVTVQSQQGAAKDSGSSVVKGVTTVTTPDTLVTPPIDLNGMHPSELPRRLKLAATLYTLRNLGKAFKVVLEGGDEDEIDILHRILGVCRDINRDELREAMIEISRERRSAS